MSKNDSLSGLDRKFLLALLIIIVHVAVIDDHSLLICLQRRWLEFTAQDSLMCEKAVEQIKEKAYPYVSALCILGLVPVEY